MILNGVSIIRQTRQTSLNTVSSRDMMQGVMSLKQLRYSGVEQLS